MNISIPGQIRSSDHTHISCGGGGGGGGGLFLDQEMALTFHKQNNISI